MSRDFVRGSQIRRAIALGWLAWLLAGGTAFAIQTQLRLDQGPYYVGEPIEIQFQITGAQREPEPRCEAEPPDGASLRLVDVVPNISTSVQVINGQVTRTESVSFICRYQFVARRAGRFQLNPFRAEQAGTQMRSNPQLLDVQDVPLDPAVRIRIGVPSTSIYVGQLIPIRIEWWLDESMQDKIVQYAIRSPLFDDPDSFRFLDDEIAMRGDQSLQISTPAGEIALRADIERRSEGDRRYLVLSADRRMVALRTGRFEFEPASVTVEEVTRWQRDLFGSRRPAGTRRLFDRDEPLSIDVAAAPAEGRPQSFGGAIGRGFSLEVAADRSVVRLGDPITLTFTVRGDGQLTMVGLPPLDRPDALPSEHFRLAEGDASGEIADGAKQFAVSVRVVDPAVKEIPALEFSWFDPELGAYQTTRSRPIALSVRAAEMISAEDVVAGRPNASADPSDVESGTGENDGPTRGSLSLIGADLSIERRVDRLVGRRASPFVLQASLYGTGIALVVGALLWQRRTQSSPRERRLREIHRAQRARIDAAAARPRREALAEIAGALRELAAADPALRSEAALAFVRECDEVLYAPAPGDDGDASARIARARILADEMIEGSR
jgi:hypothetical protein